MPIGRFGYGPYSREGCGLCHSVRQPFLAHSGVWFSLRMLLFGKVAFLRFTMSLDI